MSLIRFAERAERRGALVVLGLGTVAVLAPLALAETSVDKFFYRNLIAGWVPLATGFAAVLAFRRVGQLGLLVVGAVCAAEICAVGLIVLRPSLQRDDWRAATRAVVAQTGPVAIITVPADQGLPIKIYLPRAQVMPVRGARVREIVFLAPAPIPVAYRPPAGFTETFEGHIQRIALVRYRATYPHLVTPAAVAGHLFTTEDVLFLGRQSAPR